MEAEMAWVACDENGHEAIFSGKPERVAYPDDMPNIWYDYDGTFVNIPSGSIEKLIGRKLTWEDEPVEVKVESVKNNAVLPLVSNWVAITEALPNANEEVLTITADGWYRVMTYGNTGSIFPSQVTHWMHLPKPPCC